MFAETLAASVVAGMVTGLGGLLVFVKKTYAKNDINLMLNAAAGIMLAAAFFSLMEPALAGLRVEFANNRDTALCFASAILAGMVTVAALNAFLPHEHEISGRHGGKMELGAAWLFVIAISIHKMPEGLAIGAAFAGGETGNPESLTIGIALQNVPEGLTVAITLVAAGVSRAKASLASLLSGMMQPVGAMLGLGIAGFGGVMVPLGMAFAGGAMLFVIINEVLPEVYDARQNKKSAAALFAGFVFMCALSIAMG